MFFCIIIKKVFDFCRICDRLESFPLYPKSFSSFALHAAVAQG